uniref:H15 domain-containing protein n=1 Tax=Chelydra serpentina TaxID=8475 RepID=A0A8C3XVZ7_CHESE
MTKFPLPSPGAPTTSKHPSKPLSQGLSKLILKAVATSEKRSGLSLQALKKIIVATGYNMAKKKTHFKRVLLSLVTKGLLQKLRGTGASGSFGIGKEMAKKMGARPRKRKARKPGRKRKAGAEGSSQGARMPASQAGQQPVKVGGRTSKPGSASANTRAVKPQRRRTFEAHHLPALMT